MRRIGLLENKKSTLKASTNTLNRQIDLQQVQIKDDCEVAEMCIRENIMRLTEHAEVIKKQNSSLFGEMEELVQTDEYVRE